MKWEACDAANLAQRAAAAVLEEVIAAIDDKRRVLEDAANHDGEAILLTMLRLSQHRGRDGIRVYRTLRKYDPAAIGEGFAILVVTRDPKVALDYMSTCAAEVQRK